MDRSPEPLRHGGRGILAVTSLGLVAFCATAFVLTLHREVFARD